MLNVYGKELTTKYEPHKRELNRIQKQINRLVNDDINQQ